MPDKPLTVLTYAASASLAAIALVYLYNPSYLLDAVVPGGAAAVGASVSVDPRIVQLRGGKGRAVGLANPANDCFINSVLQVLAGLGGLQLYVVREIARRDADEQGADGEWKIYRAPRADEETEDGRAETEQDGGNGRTSSSKLELDWKMEASRRKVGSLLHAEVTRGLKAISEQLNDRSTARKTVSAAPFVRALESAFFTRVNRNQQDAQELLQVVAERMAEEYTVGKAARERAREAGVTISRKSAENAAISADGAPSSTGDKAEKVQQEAEGPNGMQTTPAVPVTVLNESSVPVGDGFDALCEEEGFPLQGQTKHQIECEHCHFIPSSKPTDFIMLTLSVPSKSPATLDDCLDQFSKPEYIDDYKCDKCKLEHCIGVYEKLLAKSAPGDQREEYRKSLFKLQLAFRNDPENPPEDVVLLGSRDAPTRRIARSVKIVLFPKILVVHLSRSSFDATLSSKNTAKVSFPERLSLGSLADRRRYRLQGVVTHKGTHHSGHYETFRRQHPYPISLADLGLADDENDADVQSPRRTPTPGLRSTTASPEPRSTTASPDPGSSKAENDSDVEAEALDRMNSATATISGPRSLGTRIPSQRSRKNPLSHISSPSLQPSMAAAPPRTSLSNLPTPESVLEQGAEAATPATDISVGKPSLEVTGGAGMERASSRQRIRERVEEAREKKDRKRLKKMLARENQRWWRISDDKVRECRTSDTLDMQKEAYLLFYEMEI